MWGNTEKSAVKEILLQYIDNDGADLAIRYFDVIKNFESVGDGSLHLASKGLWRYDYWVSWQ